MEWLRKLLTRIYDPHARLSRLHFNLVLLIAFVPVMLLQGWATYDIIDSMWQDMLSGNAPWTMQELWQEADTRFQLVDLLQLVTLVLMVPLVLWRLTDLGWSRLWALLVYAPLGLDLLARTSFVPLPGWVGLSISLFAYVLLYRLATKKGLPKVPTATL